MVVGVKIMKKYIRLLFGVVVGVALTFVTVCSFCGCAGEQPLPDGGTDSYLGGSTTVSDGGAQSDSTGEKLDSFSQSQGDSAFSAGGEQSQSDHQESSSQSETSEDSSSQSETSEDTSAQTSGSQSDSGIDLPIINL